MTTAYLVGQTKRIQCTFTDEDGSASDPAAVTLKIGRDLMNSTVSGLGTYYYASGTVSRAATGIYYRDYTFEVSGTVVFEFLATGNPTTKAVEAVKVLQPYNWV